MRLLVLRPVLSFSYPWRPFYQSCIAVGHRGENRKHYKYIPAINHQHLPIIFLFLWERWVYSLLRHILPYSHFLMRERIAQNLFPQLISPISTKNPCNNDHKDLKWVRWLPWLSSRHVTKYQQLNQSRLPFSLSLLWRTWHCVVLSMTCIDKDIVNLVHISVFQSVH